jgi:methionine sulfoxide reductase heme-binding subunit
MQGKSRGFLNGWPFTGVASLAVLAAVLVTIAVTADPAEAAHRVIRLTARTSVTLFLLAFTASALWRFWPNAWTRWQRQNRRYLGVSFATSHALHLLAILWLRQIAPADLAETTAITWIFGGLAYVFIAAIGPRAWTILHTTGAYYIWLIFANSYIARAVALPEYIPVAVLMLFTLALRIAARIARSRAVHPAVAS